MKIIEKFLTQKSFISQVLLKFLKKWKYFKISTEVKLNLNTKPPYAYCMYHSALLAKKLNIKKISVLEFGVAGGNGIVQIEKIAEKIINELGIQIEIYGFTLKDGLQNPVDFRDLPYWWNFGLYPTLTDDLDTKIKKTTKIIYGDVKDTTKTFFKQYNPAPIGVIFNDLDYFSSTLNSFEIFNNEDHFYLPRIFCYFDDIVGTEKEMFNEFTGELMAINKFNENNDQKKICLNRNLIPNSRENWRYQIYYYHNFNHKNYNDYIGDGAQKEIEDELKLKD
tara:strand:+ start:5460 stop:6296 length:837 start_codon:yes stop_codon:yes gene_type:complete